LLQLIFIPVVTLQLYNEAEGGGRGEAHTGLLRLVRMRLADAVHSVLLSSALEYASCLENFQVC
jgi:hypothetical protein